jgi:hypothetical protein
MSFESKKLWWSAGAVALTLTCAAPQVAHAGGLEDTVGGAVGLGRSAYFARVNDFMAVLQNPANLSVLPRGDLGAELRLPILKSCFDRQYDPAEQMKYKKDEAGNIVESFDEVCNSAFPGPTANIGWARSYENGVGWGIGLFTPAAGGANAKFGDSTNRTLSYQGAAERGTPTLTGMESSARILGIERNGVVAYLMAGIAYQPVKYIRFGASAGIGFAYIYNKNMISTIGGTFNDPETVNELTVKDYSIPRATASAVVAPWDWLDLMGVIAYQGDINGTGHIDVTANGLSGIPLGNCYQDPMNPQRSGSHCRVNGVKATIPNPTLEATAGIRFAHRRVKRERALDPMKDEIWDFEVDATWSQTSHVDEFLINVHDKMPADPAAPKVEFSNTDTEQRRPIPGVTRIPKYWNDSWTFRAGGDVNIVPETFSMRLGASYAPRAMNTSYANIDYAMPIQKIGVHAGLTVALGNYRVTLAYAHLFYETIDVPLGTGLVKDIAAVNPTAVDAINEGRFRGGLDVLSLQLNAKF